jgi:hypothetical protein
MTTVIRGYGVNIRESPGGRIIGTIGRGGEAAPLLKSEHGWSQYRFDRFTGWVSDSVVERITPTAIRHDVNWVSQLGIGADRWGGDCGAACLVMLIEAYKGIRPTVDDVAALFGFSETKRYGFIGDIIRAADHYGLLMGSNGNADLYYTADVLRSRPFIQLFDYDLLPSKYDLRYFAGHYGVVVGMDAGFVYLLDPYDRQRREHKLTWQQWRDVIGFSRYNAPTQAIVAAKPLMPDFREALAALRDRMSEVLQHV